MNMVKWIEFLRARLRTVVRISVIVLAALVVLDAIPGVIGKEHAHTRLERIPGFWAVFGFLGCALLIAGSKLFGRAGIVQDEDYYRRCDRRDTGHTVQ